MRAILQVTVAGACRNRTYRGPCGPQLVLKTSQATRPDPPPSLADDNLAATRRRGEGGCLPLVRRDPLGALFTDEIIANWEYIGANQLCGPAKDEVLLNAQGEWNSFDRGAKIGLFARARMFMDALPGR